MSVSLAVLMPTLPGRDELRALAMASLNKQVYPSNWDVSFYLDCNTRQTLGAKLNRMIAACEEDYIALFDDDDWHSPARLARQVEPLLRGYELSGTSHIYYQDGKNAWLYNGDGTWLGGMAFKRSLWDKLKFEDISIGCDTRWQRALKPLQYDIADPALFIATIHAGNTSPKKVFAGPHWKTADFTTVQELMNA